MPAVTHQVTAALTAAAVTAVLTAAAVTADLAYPEAAARPWVVVVVVFSVVVVVVVVAAAASVFVGGKGIKLPSLLPQTCSGGEERKTNSSKRARYISPHEKSILLGHTEVG